MQLKHVALTASSEEKSDTFYSDLLGLTKSETKILPIELSKAIFNLETELVMVNYLNADIHFEIFITGHNGDDKGTSQKIEHTCLGVDRMETFLEKCRSLNVDVVRIPKGEKTLIFIRDFDCNLFEIKEG